MSAFLEILDVFAREVLDSRGNPTVEAEVTVCCDGFFTTGRASVPSAPANMKRWSFGMERWSGIRGKVCIMRWKTSIPY